MAPMLQELPAEIFDLISDMMEDCDVLALRCLCRSISIKIDNAFAKRFFRELRIDPQLPDSVEKWKHVANHVKLRKSVRKISFCLPVSPNQEETTQTENRESTVDKQHRNSPWMSQTTSLLTCLENCSSVSVELGGGFDLDREEDIEVLSRDVWDLLELISGDSHIRSAGSGEQNGGGFIGLDFIARVLSMSSVPNHTSINTLELWLDTWSSNGLFNDRRPQEREMLIDSILMATSGAPNENMANMQSSSVYGRTLTKFLSSFTSLRTLRLTSVHLDRMLPCTPPSTIKNLHLTTGSSIDGRHLQQTLDPLVHLDNLNLDSCTTMYGGQFDLSNSVGRPCLNCDEWADWLASIRLPDHVQRLTVYNGYFSTGPDASLGHMDLAQSLVSHTKIKHLRLVQPIFDWAEDATNFFKGLSSLLTLEVVEVYHPYVWNKETFATTYKTLDVLSLLQTCCNETDNGHCYCFPDDLRTVQPQEDLLAWSRNVKVHEYGS